MKGIVLAGGAGTRLYPITRGVSKQLLPVFDKPMVYYPISTLMLAGIKEIMIISTPEDLPSFRRLLGNGENCGVQFTYAEQARPEGLAQALLIGRDFVGDDSVCLVLGDNLFYGAGFSGILTEAVQLADTKGCAVAFGYHVADPTRYGVVELDAQGNCVSLEEKPQNPKSNYAIVGLYFYPRGVAQIAAGVKPSERGELEIISVLEEYRRQGRLRVRTMGRGYAWLDTGTHDSLSEASIFVEVIEKRTGTKVACLEGIAYEKGWINAQKLREAAQPMLGNEYGQYLLALANNKHHP